ncbi:MAG: hypothetical protein E7108_04945 [Bacteroidales bacterium]|jgi:hypothetical protein|nr:hypothetical protein [Bacteroidales bacterium]
MIRSLFLIPVCFLIIASCSHELDVVNKSNSDEKVFEKQSLSKTSDTDGFYVSENLLKKYLRFFCKNKTAEKIKPNAKNDEILAYYVQYANNKGWDLISADKRLSPILVSSDKGILPDNFEEISYLSPISGMLHSVIDIRKSNCNDENGIWNFLSPNSKYERYAPVELKNKIATKSGNGLKGLGQGMWIAVDTTISYTTTTVGKLTNSQWNQIVPYNSYTPFDNGVQCPVGCGPVAIGQLLYKYIKDNPGQHAIPSTASVNGSSVSFGSFSTEAWSHLKPNCNNNFNYDTTAVFLSWIGSQMPAEYHFNRTGTTWGQDTTMLREYLNFSNGFAVNSSSNSTTKNSFCGILISSLDLGSPLYVVANDSHAFLIDYYERYAYQYTINYVFDPYHIITDDEYYSYPSWRFDWPNNYDPDKDIAEFDEIVNMTDNIYIRMNWGNHYIGTNPNNISYLLRTLNHFLGENGTYYQSDSVNLNWANYSEVNNFAYNFSRKQ